MLTPPFHFSLVACSAAGPTEHDEPDQSLYRGGIPLSRNLPFIQQFDLRTIIYLRRTPLEPTDVLCRWAEAHYVELRWVKADPMSEESLGMGRAEAGEVLKVGNLEAGGAQLIADGSFTVAVSSVHRRRRWYLPLHAGRRLPPQASRMVARLHHERTPPVRASLPSDGDLRLDLSQIMRTRLSCPSSLPIFLSLHPQIPFSSRRRPAQLGCGRTPSSSSPERPRANGPNHPPPPLLQAQPRILQRACRSRIPWSRGSIRLCESPFPLKLRW